MPAHDPLSLQARQLAKLRQLWHEPFAFRLAVSSGILILLAWSLLAVDFWHKTARGEAVAQERAAAIARTMDERVQRTLRAADQLLKISSQEIQEEKAWADARAVTRILRRLDAVLDEMLALSFVNAEGICIGPASPALPLGGSAVGRDAFRAHSARPNLGLFVEEPTFDAASGQPVFAVSRRISGADGAFLGILVASMRTVALAADFARATIGQKGAANLFHIPSQRIIVRQPASQEAFGKTLRYRNLQEQLAQAPQGVFMGDASFDGEERIFAYRRIGELPLAVSVGLSTGEIRASLLREFASTLLLALALSIIIGYGAWLILAAHRREVGLKESMRRAQEDMRIAREFFQHTFDAAPVGMAITDAGGRYTRINQAMCEFTGYSEVELLSMSYADITHPDDVERNFAARQSLLDARRGSFQMEKRYVRKDGREIWALTVVSLVSDSSGRPRHSIGQTLDIDAQKRAEEALRISEERFRGIFENANTGIAATNKHGQVIYFNEAFRAMLGYDAEALARKSFADLTVPEDFAREAVLFEEVLNGQRDKYQLEKRYISRQGKIIWVDLFVSTIRDQQGDIINFIGVVSDITERKESALALADSRQQLRALAAYQEEMLERERKHIAREVHDELGQLLTALKMDLSLVRLRFSGHLPLLAMVETMRLLVERTINVVRQVASNLRPSALDHGLAPAIEWLADDFARRWSIPCSVDVGDIEIVLEDAQSTAVFRVVQESLTNVARHAQAQEVLISLRESAQRLQVIVKDDGIGFDPLALGKPRGFGLIGMRERVLALGGTLRIDSAPGRGCAVTIKLPLLNSEQP
jgi:PAS domain S-box-containing protein